jgi:hypothetical protein
MRRRFISVCVIVLVLVGGLSILGRRLEAAPPADNPGTPFAAILEKLDQVLATVGGGVSGVTSRLDAVLGYLDFFNGGGAVVAWDRAFPTETRFVVLNELNAEAFLDRETGLVWDRHGSTGNLPGGFPGNAWAGAAQACYDKTVGGRKGWRPAMIEELASLLGSLLDVNGLHFPPGLITGSVTSFIWTSTTVAGDPSKAWALAAGQATPFDKTVCCGTGVWCVRGGHGHDGQ